MGILSQTNTINFLLEICITAAFLFTIHQNPDKTITWWNRLLSFLFLFSLLPLFMLTSDTWLFQYLRVPYRVICYTGCFCFGKGLSLVESIYNSLILSTVNTAYTNLWTIPANFAFIEKIRQTQAADSLFSIGYLCIVKNIVFISVLFLFSHFFEFNRSRPLSNIRIGCAIIVLIIETYVKETLFYINHSSSIESPTISAYIVLFVILMLIALILMNYTLDSIREREERKTEELTNEYRFRSLRLQNENMQNTRRLYHDMKNHLLTLDDLSKGSSSTEVHQYISDLLGELSSPVQPFNTGNELIDGLLSYKAEEARKKDITFNVSLLFDEPLMIRDSDLCTIFGNALDNAIEAAGQVDQKEERIIEIRNFRQGNYIAVSFVNSYKNEIRKENGKIISSKQNRAEHGIGIGNIQKAADRAGAAVSIDTSTPHIFRISILFPIQKG